MTEERPSYNVWKMIRYFLMLAGYILFVTANLAWWSGASTQNLVGLYGTAIGCLVIAGWD